MFKLKNMDLKEIFDISPLISEKIAVFPGDVPFSRKISQDFKGKNHYSLSSVKMSLHTGSHSDAPSHYHPQGPSIDEVSLYPYLGLCQLIRVSIKEQRIKPEHIKKKPIQAKRILFATDSYLNPNQWKDDFISLSVELIRYLSKKNVLTLGVDTPSIDPAHSKELEAHKEAFKKNITILEGLCLKNVPEGTYQLIALPLKIKKGEASPVRALLISSKIDLKNL